MTNVEVNSGNCGFTVRISAEKGIGRTVTIVLDTECSMVRDMMKDISSIDLREMFLNHINNPVYRAASRHLKHAACPVPSAILKAAEVELGLCLPEDVRITFGKDDK